MSSDLVKCFTTREVMRWPWIEELYGPTLRETQVFAKGGDGSGTKRWDDLHTRIVEHVRSSSSSYIRALPNQPFHPLRIYVSSRNTIPA